VGFLRLALTPVLILASCSKAPPPASRNLPSEPVQITQFYASPANPPRGQKTLICYGVANATAVRIDPPVETVWPAYSRCFDLVPAKEVSLTLTAERGTEHVSQSVTVKPGPPAVRIVEVSINKLDLMPGEQAMICYKVENAVSVTITPGTVHPDVGCAVEHPMKTTTYTVTATGAAGDTDTERVTARVK
jgi:hypothetical protein